jgi:hypothetical protein
MSYTSEMLARMKARREKNQKIANKTRELEHERRGKVLGMDYSVQEQGPAAAYFDVHGSGGEAFG